MARPDLYELLGVSRDVSPEDLKRAYRRLVKELHPDRHPGDTRAVDRFKEINAAYDILKDPKKRSVYDRFGAEGLNGRGQAGNPYGQADIGDAFASMFGEIFGDFVGGGGGQRTQRVQRQGRDVRYDIDIDLEAAFHGREVNLRVACAVACSACASTGSASRSAPQHCGTCNGAGRVRSSQGFMTFEQTCPACRGQGQRIHDPCRACGGTGRRRGEHEVKVRIPAGIRDGATLRVAGRGEAGIQGGPAGDLLLVVSMRPHRRFKRDGDHLLTGIDIPMTVAALGGEVEAPTLDGEVTTVTVPAGTQSGSRLRARGEGMPNLQSGRRGDLHLDVLVRTPTRLNRRQRKLLEQFAELSRDE